MFKTQEQLQAVFQDNFMAYYRSHVAHANIVGRNFYSDHKLLGKIYEHLQGNIDVLAELLRTLGEFMPASIMAATDQATIADSDVIGTADDMLALVRDDIMALDEQYQELVRRATDESIDEIADFAQGEIRALRKFVWMLDSSLMPEA
jgi:starvation-inducible DNA-binding protein